MKRKFLTAGREKWLRYLAHSLALFLTVEKYTFNIRENKSNWFLTLVLSVTSDFRF